MNQGNPETERQTLGVASAEGEGLVRQINSNDWRGRASCLQSDPEKFFSDKDQSAADAKRVCASCDVVNECLSYALDNGESFGVWGGLTAKERRLKSPNAPGEGEVARSHRNRAVMELRKHGRSAPSIARTTGLNERTIYRIIKRAAVAQKSA